MTGQDRDKDDLHVPPPAEQDRPHDPSEDQAGIIPGKIPGNPTDTSDPRFPGSIPDLA